MPYEEEDTCVRSKTLSTDYAVAEGCEAKAAQRSCADTRLEHRPKGVRLVADGAVAVEGLETGAHVAEGAGK